MTLTPGTRLGPYEILAPLGAGGMGQVYHARDTRLDRSVAIKSLAGGLAGDSERLARFEREARLLASLNHPNIGAIYGVEDVAGTPHLVLEFVDGETLGGRLARGALPVREAVEIAVQIASAVEAAHAGGIVHRDLKPGNVMLSASGVVKVLDFGLARGGAPASGIAADLSASPTVALSATREGVILGTAPYMSPEQARGRTVDQRADIWAFGCLLYELLTGRPAFTGESVSDVVARIIEKEPDWNALPMSVPPVLGLLIRRCLTKDAAARPAGIGPLRKELQALALEFSTAPPPAATPATRERPSLAVLYFENLSSDPESDYFCAGITEDIVTDLSKIKGLKVASRNAVARYRGQAVEISQVGAELGVRCVLEGSVRRAGDRVRISAQLINAADGFHLWAERFDRTLEDVFAVQEEIASSIATALQVALSPAEADQLADNRPNDVRAYDLYLKGREHYSKYGGENLRKALALFREATVIDPTYALAWAGLADSYSQLCQWNASDDPDGDVQRALEAARHAVTLNPRLAEAHKAEALAYMTLGDTEAETASLARAIEVNPRFTPALTNLAVRHFVSSDIAGAERLHRRCIDIDPQERFSRTWLAWILVLTRRDEEALAEARQTRHQGDDLFYVTAVHTLNAMVGLNRGDAAAVEAAIRDGLADGAHPESLRAAEAMLLVRAGRHDEVRSILRSLETMTTMGSGAIILAAEAAASMGDHDLASRFLERRIVSSLGRTTTRIIPGLHPLLDREPYAPRRSENALIWPLEAPMMDPAVHACFREVRIESGRPEGSSLRREG